MITNKLFSLVGLLALAVPCFGTALWVVKKWQGNNNISFIPFPKLLAQVKNATFKDYADTDVGSGDAFLGMKMHILDMYDGVTVENITTFVLEQEYGDCIAIKE